jgi:broad specificity phosphatase PhoE
MKKKITIIRHAQSIFNCGQFKHDSELLNCPLSDFGKMQAKSLNQTFDVIVISTLSRAMETYLNSNIKADNVIQSHLFREQRETSILNFLEGEEIIPESSDDVRKRAREAIAYIKTLDYENIGIISHGYFIWYFLEQCGQQPIPTHNTQAISFEL